MVFSIIVSSKDRAGLNIKTRLASNGFVETEEFYDGFPVLKRDSVKLYTAVRDSVNCESIDKDVDGNMLIFATKHESKAGIPSFSTHCIGNWGPADFGGRKKTLCLALPLHMRDALLILQRLNVQGFDVVQEATHHGPYVEKPSLFIEIGSSDKEWVRTDCGNVIADTLLKIISIRPEDMPVAIGIGGLHTSPNFVKVAMRERLAFSHICPKYALEYLDEDMMRQAINKSIPKPTTVYLDWKGLGKHKQKVKALAENSGLEIRRV